MAAPAHVSAATMDALVWTAPKTMEVQEVAVPAPAEHELLLEVAAVGICGSELSGYLGHNSLRVPPLIMGHEFSARVVAAGHSTLADGSKPQPGQLLAVNPLISCGACDLCARGLPQLCRRRGIIGAFRPGAFARYVTVPAAQCFPLPEGMSDVAAGPGGAAGLRRPHGGARLERAGVGRAEPLLILGAGAIGLCCLAVARAEGAGTIVISDIVDVRLAVAEGWGATTADQRSRRGRCPAAARRAAAGRRGGHRCRWLAYHARAGAAACAARRNRRLHRSARRDVAASGQLPGAPGDQHPGQLRLHARRLCPCPQLARRRRRRAHGAMD